MAIEIEAKIYIADIESFRSHLQTVGAQVIAERYHERNQLYTSSYQDFDAEKWVLRVRNDPRGDRVTFKSPAADVVQGTNSRNEFETSVGDGRVMDEILQRLGYHHGLFYEKYRTIYRLPDIGNVELMIDELPYGNFIEIEGAPRAIEQAIDVLGLQEAHRVFTNYAGIFEAIRKKLGLAMSELTFTNFSLIKVDPEIFANL